MKWLNIIKQFSVSNVYDKIAIGDILKNKQEEQTSFLLQNTNLKTNDANTIIWVTIN